MVLALQNNGTGYERYDLKLEYEAQDGTRQSQDTAGVILPGLTVDVILPAPATLAPGDYGVFATLTYRAGQRAEAVSVLTVD